MLSKVSNNYLFRKNKHIYQYIISNNMSNTQEITFNILRDFRNYHKQGLINDIENSILNFESTQYLTGVDFSLKYLFTVTPRKNDTTTISKDIYITFFTEFIRTYQSLILYFSINFGPMYFHNPSRMKKTIDLQNNLEEIYINIIEPNMSVMDLSANYDVYFILIRTMDSLSRTYEFSMCNTRESHKFVNKCYEFVGKILDTVSYKYGVNITNLFNYKSPIVQKMHQRVITLYNFHVKTLTGNIEEHLITDLTKISMSYL